MIEKAYTISGMKCVNCKARVENAIKGLLGVDDAIANLEEATITVNYDESQVTPQMMKDAVDDLGRFEMKI